MAKKVKETGIYKMERDMPPKGMPPKGMGPGMHKMMGQKMPMKDEDMAAMMKKGKKGKK